MTRNGYRGKGIPKGRHYGRKPLHTRGLHIVALFEGAKGALVLLTGFGLLSFLHKDAHALVASLISHSHLNPASHYPRIFLALADRIDDRKLWLMAGAALMYSVARLAEAVGLWHRRKWAEWLGALTGCVYIPLEIFELTRSVTWPKVTVFVINVCVVAYLLWVLIGNGRDGSDRHG